MRKIHKISIVGGTVATLMVGGIAYAAWTSEGAGTGTVTAGSAGSLTVSQAGTSSGLYPSGSQTIDVKIDNGNDYAVALRTMTVTGVTVENGGIDENFAACSADDVEPTVVNAAAGTSIAAHGTTTVDGAVKLYMKPDASSNCQSANFKVAVKATADSNPS